MQGFRKVLVVSFNCFSQSKSNGRTIANLFEGWDKERLAQFYMCDEVPDYQICNSYFRVTDAEALRAFVFGGSAGGVMTPMMGEDNAAGNLQEVARYSRKNRRKPFYKAARDIVWNSSRWKSTKFIDWIDAFDPEVVFLLSAKNSFVHNVAYHIAKKRNIPLVIYHCEDYYFKKRASKSIFELIYRHSLSKSMRMIMGYSKCVIYNNEYTKELYETEFKTPGVIIYNKTNIEPVYRERANSSLTISYLGNLGNSRHESLIALAEALHGISEDLIIHVYGTIRSEKDKADILNCQAIRYHGSVDYDECKKIMLNSDILVHVESFKEFYKRDLRIAFTTKIADSLASGSCFLVYAPGNLACTKYLVSHDAACVLTETSMLKEELEKILINRIKRDHFIRNALDLAGRNHNPEVNAGKFKAAIDAI